jgi:hypothetical protein
MAFVWLYRLCPSVVDAVAIIKPGTVIHWHRRGFRALWRWKSRSRGGRPAIPREIRDLIQEMSRANGLWGAPRIHGELLKLSIEVAQSTVAKHMIKRPGRPDQSWTTFLRNHAAGIAAVDMFVVPTIGFKLLYCLVFLAHGRRELVHHAVTANPTAEWVARQITEAFPWDMRGHPPRQRELLAALVERIVVQATAIGIEIQLAGVAAVIVPQGTSGEAGQKVTLNLLVPIELRRRGVEAKLVMQVAAAVYLSMRSLGLSPAPGPAPRRDQALG